MSHAVDSVDSAALTLWQVDSMANSRHVTYFSLILPLNINTLYIPQKLRRSTVYPVYSCGLGFFRAFPTFVLRRCLLLSSTLNTHFMVGH